ncbi:LuxR C-terminal-related transcriptional regulator [Thorsellia anophelis]|uniref:Two component transcriptional regulator, LuxR family n=1 Tax=Thorsellia anophelis DSM 18579 TaxID=1123402 RepID=A0A1H9Y7A0_9GAMM|nr:LuxR C-terminal-related transcriptional regulator [Thorsellia anophelis]SES64693.1 two component transcriptional regulator, LuxR family [Thorsellia anophelis DSM 18579]
MMIKNNFIGIVDGHNTVITLLSPFASKNQWQFQTYTDMQAVKLCSLKKTSLIEKLSCLIIQVESSINYINALEWLKLNHRLMPVIVISEKATADLCRQVFKLGAFEFLTTHSSPSQWVDSINEAILHYERNCDYFAYQRRWQAILQKLSTREKDVLCHLVQGKTNKEIASQLFISPRTIETHRANIFQKLEAPNLAQIIKTYYLAEAYHLSSSHPYV